MKVYVGVVLCVASCGGGTSSSSSSSTTPEPVAPSRRDFDWGVGQFGCRFTHAMEPLTTAIKDFLSAVPNLEVTRDDVPIGFDESNVVERVCIDEAGVRVMCVVPTEDGLEIDRFMVLGGDAGTDEGLALGETLGSARTFYPGLACVIGEGETWGMVVCDDPAFPWLRLLADSGTAEGGAGERLSQEAFDQHLAGLPITQAWSVRGPWIEPGWEPGADEDEASDDSDE